MVTNCSFAAMAAGSTPSALRRLPSRASSPTIIYPLAASSDICPDAARTATHMGKSREMPDFFVFAGARFIIIFFCGRLKPLFLIADFMRSLDSFTAVSASPTISMPGRPAMRSASTSMRYPSIPERPQELTLAKAIMFSLLNFYVKNIR
jgi:hypothetical protein